MMHPGREIWLGSVGSANTYPSLETFLNISANMFCAIVARSCCGATRTVRYCRAGIVPPDGCGGSSYSCPRPGPATETAPTSPRNTASQQWLVRHAERSEINRIGRNSGNQPALEDPGGGGFLRCRTGCTASKRLRVEDHVLPDRNKTCPRILHSPRSLRQVDCSPGLSSPPGRSRPQKTLRHVTNELKVALAGHAAIWARHSPQNPRQRLGPPADIRRSTRIIEHYRG